MLRIGINVGDVIVDGEDLYGDGVNVAARIEALANPGEIWISDAIYAQVRHKVDLGYEDMGEQSVKNIADPIHVYRIAPTTEEEPGASLPLSDALFRRPAVAVLPFENLSGDAEQEYFADGLTEDIITALSLWKSFPVIARNSSFAFKGQSPDIRKVGEELGASYVIEGSVRKSGTRVRVTAQLINSETGHHVWAERYDRDLEDIFELQDELTQRIAATVAPELERTEHERSLANRPNLGAWDYVQRGLSFVDLFTKEGNIQAREMFERALELDPAYSQAFIVLARSYYLDIRWGFAEAPDDTTAKLLEAARRAVELDNLDPKAHWVLGNAHQASAQYEMAISECERAVELNPNFAFAYFSLGASNFYLDRTEDALTNLQKAHQLNPRDPRNFALFFVFACVYFKSDQYQEAVDWAKKAIQLRSDWWEPHLVLASSLGHLNRPVEAQPVLKQLEQLRSHGKDSQQSTIVAYNLDYQHILDGLRKAPSAPPPRWP